MNAALTRSSLLRYGTLGIPLGCIGLPLYVHLPKYYSDTLPLSLGTIGYIMFLARIVDCAADPYIGYRLSRNPRWAGLLVNASRIGLGAGVFGLFFLPALDLVHPALPLCILLMATYLCYSVVSISYYSDGVAMATDYHQSARVSAFREASIIVGVMFASLFPVVLKGNYGEVSSYHQFAIVFIAILCAASAMYHGRQTTDYNTVTTSPWTVLFGSRSLRWIFVLYFVNAIATSITSTLFLFFVSDILETPDLSGVFLCIYFAGAIAAMPLWLRLNQRYRKRKCLIFSMLAAITSFAWAYALGPQDIIQFYVICLVSGMALGGDLALLPSLLSDELKERAGQSALEFGIWNFISKFNLALAAGIALPLVGGANHEHYRHVLRLSYAILPCLFKLAALTLLFISPLDRRTSV